MAELPTITSPTRDAIFAAYEADSGDGFRSHLGASLIGAVGAQHLNQRILEPLSVAPRLSGVELGHVSVLNTNHF